jgi:potassium-dependent mechanosensitive channel
MIRVLARLVLLAGLLLATAARAQDAPPGAIDIEAFRAAATAAEGRIGQPSAADAELEAMRADLANWRVQLLAAENANAATIQRLQTQIDALGPAPEEGSGVTEPTEIAERRAELLREFAEAQLPRVTALEAFNRADGLIREIDATLRERQRQTLLQRGPSPLRPASLAAAATAVTGIFQAIRSEVGETRFDPETRASVREAAPVFLGLTALGFLFLLRGRAWVGRLASVAHRRRARDTVVFLVSLGQVFLPVMGAIIVVIGVVLTGVAGDKLTAILGGVAGLLATTFAALWLAGRIFPSDETQPAAVPLDGPARKRVRTIAVGIGVVLGLGGILEVIVGFEEVDDGARAVFLLPYFLVLSVGFWALALALSSALPKAKAAAEEDSPAFVWRILGLVVTFLRLIAIAGPLLAIAGFTNAAFGIMHPTALSLGLLAFFLALQVPIRDLYALLTRTSPEEAGRALVPVLVNFLLAVASLPVLALIWGARRAEIVEVYARIQEGFSLGGTRITPSAILTVIFVFTMVLIVTRLIQAALRGTVLPRTKLDQGAQNAVTAGVGYVGIAAAGLVAINAAGIDLTALAFVGAALSVGIGFGLRNVIENFVAGLILLIERPISEGDWIEVGGNMGIVKQISVRSTVIETFDRQQLIVPNGDFITGTVTNWTRGSNIGRAVVTVGVAYGSDTRRVQEILLEILRGQDSIMRFPEPAVDFMGFGADSLEFRARGILYDVNTLISVKTEMHHQIAERFRAEGIEIPFAQRDIWLRNPEALVPGAAPLTGAGQSGAAPQPVPPRTPVRREPEGIEAAAEDDGEGR